MTFVPAYIMLFVSEKSLAGVCHVQDQESCEAKASRLDHMLRWLGGFSYQRWKLIVAFTLFVVAISAFGISKIKVNDNPIKWFTNNHRIRVADRVLNNHFDGTYTAYLTLRPELIRPPTCAERVDMMRTAAIERFGDTLPEAAQIFLQILDEANEEFQSLHDADIDRCFVDLVDVAKGLDEQVSGAWNALGDAIVYLDPEGLDYAMLSYAIATTVDDATR